MLATKAARKAGKPAPRPKLEKLIKHLKDRDWSKARPLSAELLKKHPNDVNALTLGARVALNAERDAELALERAEAALRIAPDAAEGHSGVLSALTALGDRAAVADAAERWIAADPCRAGGYYELARVDARRAAKHIPMMRGLLATPGINGLSKGMLTNAFGLIYEKDGRTEDAFRAFVASKSALERLYEPAPYKRFRDACDAAFSSERLAALAELGSDDPRMVFIVGLPRTGSTLIERVICAHPEAAAIGEARAIDTLMNAQGAGIEGHGAAAERIDAFLGRGGPALRKAAAQYLAAVAPQISNAGAARWIDKMPGNFVFAGLIAALFPKARLIMTDRDPRDAMLSCLRTFFTVGQSFTADFESFLAHWRVQQAFAALWRARLGGRYLDMRYEDMIAEPAAQARRLINHIGLDWDERCARPEEQAGIVQTASAFQVREKIHARSVGGWRRYETAFAPMNAALAQIGWSPR